MTFRDVGTALSESKEIEPDTVKRSPAVEYGADYGKLRGQYADSYQSYDRVMRDMYGGSDQ